MTNTKHYWVRSPDGMILGVCKGLAETFGTEVWLLRIIWLIALLWFGTGLVLYLILAYTLPRADKLDQAYHGKLLGVCARIAIRYEIEVGLVRFLTVLFALSTFGLALLVYILCYFLVPKEVPPKEADVSPRRSF